MQNHVRGRINATIKTIRDEAFDYSRCMAIVNRIDAAADAMNDVWEVSQISALASGMVRSYLWSAGVLHRRRPQWNIWQNSLDGPNLPHLFMSFGHCALASTGNGCMRQRDGRAHGDAAGSQPRPEAGGSSHQDWTPYTRSLYITTSANPLCLVANVCTHLTCC